MAVTRGAFVTVGQIAFYEQVKQLLLASGYFKDNVVTHFSSSFAAGKSSTNDVNSSVPTGVCRKDTDFDVQ